MSAAAARPKATTMMGELQPRPGASMMPKVSVDEEHDHADLTDRIETSGVRRL